MLNNSGNSQISLIYFLDINIKSKMSAKRPASYTVDEKTLEPIDNNTDNNQKPSTEEATANRTIVTVKKDEEAPKPEVKQEAKKPLFANLFSGNGVGLFNNTGLFSGVTNTFNSNKIDLSSPNLFTGNGLKPTLNLFNNSDSKNATPGNIFGFGAGTSLPPVRAGEEDEDGDSAELEEKQNLPIDKSKSTGTYEYKTEMKVAFTGHVKKYKKNNGDLIENVEVVVQLKEETNTVLLIVRLPATKHPIFAGLLLPSQFCHLRQLNNKQENLELVAVSAEEGKKPMKDKLKLQFENAEAGKQFQDAVASLIGPDSKQKDEGEKKEGEEKKEEKKEAVAEQK